MPPIEHQSEIEDLRARLRRLEDAHTSQRSRGRTNLPGAARYLGISEETLRRRHLEGRGPPRSKMGSRNWSYRFIDLDQWADTQAA